MQLPSATQPRSKVTRNMRVLFVGDIVGSPGRQIVATGWRTPSRSGGSTW